MVMAGRRREETRRREQEQAPHRDWLVAAVAVIGLVVAAYLTFTKWSGGGALFCTAGSGCDVIQASRYSLLLGLPTALWGAALYAAIAGLALSGLSPRRWLAAFLMAVAGASFSLYLTYLSALVIRALCGYCLASNAVAVALFGLLLARRPSSSGRRSPTRPARVIALGALAAVAAIVFGAGIFAWEPPQEASAYREALARHLASTGAIFYGAYW